MTGELQRRINRALGVHYELTTVDGYTVCAVCCRDQGVITRTCKEQHVHEPGSPACKTHAYLTGVFDD